MIPAFKGTVVQSKTEAKNMQNSHLAESDNLGLESVFLMLNLLLFTCKHRFPFLPQRVVREIKYTLNT